MMNNFSLFDFSIVSIDWAKKSSYAGVGIYVQLEEPGYTAYLLKPRDQLDITGISFVARPVRRKQRGERVRIDVHAPSPHEIKEWWITYSRRKGEKKIASPRGFRFCPDLLYHLDDIGILAIWLYDRSPRRTLPPILHDGPLNVCTPRYRGVALRPTGRRGEKPGIWISGCDMDVYDVELQRPTVLETIRLLAEEELP